MKTIRFILLFVSMVMALSCIKEVPVVDDGADYMVLTASAAPSLRSTASPEGLFAWQEGDCIRIVDEWSSWQLFNLTSGAGTGSAEFTSENKISAIGDYAFFLGSGYDIPYYSDQGFCLYMPDYYGYSPEGRTYSPMVALVPKDEHPSLAFKHLAGLIKLTVKGIGGYLYSVKLTSKGFPISGVFPIQDLGSDNPRIDASIWDENASGSKDIWYYAYEPIPGGEAVLYFPVPTGLYDGFTFTVSADDVNLGNTTIVLDIDRSIQIEAGDLRTVEIDMSEGIQK